MTHDQAIEYLETTDHIPAREMSPAMYRLLRAAARTAYRYGAGMAGYYDPEYTGPRARPWRLRDAPATVTAQIPQSPDLRRRILARIPDPWAAWLNPRPR